MNQDAVYMLCSMQKMTIKLSYTYCIIHRFPCKLAPYFDCLIHTFLLQRPLHMWPTCQHKELRRQHINKIIWLIHGYICNAWVNRFMQGAMSWLIHLYKLGRAARNANKRKLQNDKNLAHQRIWIYNLQFMSRTLSWYHHEADWWWTFKSRVYYTSYL